MFEFFNFPAWVTFTNGTGPWWLGGVLALLIMAFWLMRTLSAPPPVNGSNRALDAVDTVIGWPPEATRLLTHRHRRAYEVLRHAVPEYYTFAQVPIARFMRVPTRMSYSEWLRRVGNACVDLVVCDPGSNVVAVVEVRAATATLNNHSLKRQQRVERVLRAAGIQVLVWEETHLPAPHEVRRELMPSERNTDERVSGAIVPSAPSPLDSIEPPRSTWFDEINATRPADFDVRDGAPTSAVLTRPVSAHHTGHQQVHTGQAIAKA